MEGAGFRAAWAHRQWRALLASYAISGTGDWLFATALVVYVLNATGSASWVAGAILARQVPRVLLSPLGGVLADRLDRRRLMVAIDLINAALMGLLALAVAADAKPALVVGLAVLNAAVTVAYRPAVAAATPTVVSESALAGANAAEAIVGQLAVFAGPALAAAVLAWSTPTTAMAGNALTFLVSAVLVATVRDAGGRGAPGATTEQEDSNAESGMAQELRTGWRVVRHTPGLPAVTLLITLTLLTFGMEGVLHVLIAVQRLGGDPSFVGVMVAAIGIGGLAVGPLVSRIAASPRLGRWMIACAILQGAPLMLLAVISSRPLALVVLGAEGVGVLAFEVVAMTTVQRLSGDALARVFGIQDSLGSLAILLGSLLAPVLVENLSLEWAMVLGGLPLVVLGVLGAPALIEAAARAGRVAEAVAPVADVLAGLGLFEGADRMALETVAAAVTTERVPAGTVVIAEGAAADDLFVIRSGTFAASTAADGHLRDMHGDDWFGELGLLRRSRRTAAVTSTTDGELWRIPGATFLDALAHGSALPDPLRRSALERFQRTHPGVPADLAS